MSCKTCVAVIGQNYSISGGLCGRCGCTPHDRIGTYLGMRESWHVFRIHPKTKCWNCDASVSHDYIQCDDSAGIDVTEEFRTLKPIEIKRVS